MLKVAFMRFMCLLLLSTWNWERERLLFWNCLILVASGGLRGSCVAKLDIFTACPYLLLLLMFYISIYCVCFGEGKKQNKQKQQQQQTRRRTKKDGVGILRNTPAVPPAPPPSPGPSPAFRIKWHWASPVGGEGLFQQLPGFYPHQHLADLSSVQDQRGGRGPDAHGLCQLHVPGDVELEHLAGLFGQVVDVGRHVAAGWAVGAVAVDQGLLRGLQFRDLFPEFLRRFSDGLAGGQLAVDHPPQHRRHESDGDHAGKVHGLLLQKPFSPSLAEIFYAEASFSGQRSLSSSMGYPSGSSMKAMMVVPAFMGPASRRILAPLRRAASVAV